MHMLSILIIDIYLYTYYIYSTVYWYDFFLENCFKHIANYDFSFSAQAWPSSQVPTDVPSPTSPAAAWGLNMRFANMALTMALDASKKWEPAHVVEPTGMQGENYVSRCINTQEIQWRHMRSV